MAINVIIIGAYTFTHMCHNMFPKANHLMLFLALMTSPTGSTSKSVSHSCTVSDARTKRKANNGTRRDDRKITVSKFEVTLQLLGCLTCVSVAERDCDLLARRFFSEYTAAHISGPSHSPATVSSKLLHKHQAVPKVIAVIYSSVFKVLESFNY